MLERIKIKDILSVYSTYHKEGSTGNIKNRASYGLSFATSGKIVYGKDGRSVTEDTAHAVLLPMGESYSLRCVAEGHFPLINFTTAEPLSKDILSFPIVRSGFFTDKHNRLREAFFGYGNTARAMSILYDILDELSHESMANEHRAVTAATEYILTHFYDSTLSTEIIANTAGVSEAYLRRLFQTACGTSPKAYLQAVRIRRAKELLSLGFYSVSQIASECGYASIYNFCRVFKLEAGITPKEYAARYHIEEL